MSKPMTYGDILAALSHHHPDQHVVYYGLPPLTTKDLIENIKAQDGSSGGLSENDPYVIADREGREYYVTAIETAIPDGGGPYECVIWVKPTGPVGGIYVISDLDGTELI